MIKSLLDTDLYKLTMMQVVFEKYPGVHVRYDFKCRNMKLPADDNLFVQDIKAAIKDYCELKFQIDEIYYLKRFSFFKPAFLEYLRIFKPNYEYVGVGKDKNGDMSIIIEGPWISTIMFEVPILSIVSELYHEHYGSERANAIIKSKENIQHKINFLKQNIHRDSIANFRLSDFGTRRRYSFDNQDLIIAELCNAGLLHGTSNVFFAKKYGIKPMGTMAHEYICAHQQLGRVEDCQINAFQTWADVYRGDLGIALSDTVGFSAFLKDFDLYFAKLFDGARHDSGDPYSWARRLIHHYNSMKIDPKTKYAVFSDGLTVQLAVNLFHEFEGHLNTSFGIGTDLTNDCGDEALQIVIKMTECNGRPVAKISDSPGKGMCRDESFKRYITAMFK